MSSSQVLHTTDNFEEAQDLCIRLREDGIEATVISIGNGLFEVRIP